MDTPIENFDLRAAFLTWVAVILVVGILGFLLSSLFSGVFRGGLRAAVRFQLTAVRNLFGDVTQLSGRRVWAITWHAVIESLRRRILVVFGVFALLFLFAGWYLPSRPTEQVRVYVSFVMMSSMLIAMIAVVLLAAMSLPGDIRSQTIHTVVTKPIRRLEIVLGRVLGFTIVASALLLVMGLFSYIYLIRSVNGSLKALDRQLQRAVEQGDVQHQAQLEDDIEQIRSKMTARVPIRGQLVFRNQRGEFKATSHSVGDPGDDVVFRSYIAGNTTEAAIWHFTDLPVEAFVSQGRIPLEFSFTVFRTTKGNLGEGVVIQLTYRNPKTGREIADIPFEVREYYVNVTGLGLEMPIEQELEQLFEGSEGELVIEARCLTASQYVGMTHYDLHILLDNASFGLNFSKGMFGVWLRVFLIICVAVTASTVLSGPVAILATVAVFIGGLQMSFLRQLASGENLGGGPLEAMWRLLTHLNLVRSLGEGFWVELTQKMDSGFLMLLKGLTYVLPDLGWFNTAPLVTDGFDISLSLLARTVLVALGYGVPFTVAAWLLLQAREIAR